MNKLKSIIKDKSIELLVWDFDGVIFDMDWYYQGTPYDLLEDLYEKINAIDNSIISDRDEFVARLFPYPEINEVGIRHGKDKQLEVKAIFKKKEAAALDRAVANQEVIDFIKDQTLPQAIWSNNLSSTIEYLLVKAEIDDKINIVSTLDKVIMSKPDIEGFEIIRKEYPKVSKDKILMIGDSLRSDKVGAENVGIGFYHYS